jgi:hypothetical protein
VGLLADVARDHVARQDGPPTLLRGVIRTSPVSADERVYVTVTTQGRSQRQGPCRWTPRGGLWPSAGDPCLVELDEHLEPLVAWWEGAGNGNEPLVGAVPVYISEAAPIDPPDTYMWVELLGGGDFTIWIEDGT